MYIWQLIELFFIFFGSTIVSIVLDRREDHSGGTDFWHFLRLRFALRVGSLLGYALLAMAFWTNQPDFLRDLRLVVLYMVVAFIGSTGSMVLCVLSDRRLKIVAVDVPSNTNDPDPSKRSEVFPLTL